MSGITAAVLTNMGSPFAYLQALELTMQQLNDILQVASVTLLVLTGLMLTRYVRQGQHILVGIGFTLSIICYLIIETPAFHQPFLWPIVLTGSICVPLFFWLMSKAIFEDHFRLTPIVAFWFLVQILAHGIHYFEDPMKSGNPSFEIVSILTQILSIGFVLAGLYTALKTRQGDLIDSRLYFRNVFVVITAGLIGATLIVELTPIASESALILQAAQRIIMLALSTFFLMSNWDARPGFFFREIPKPKSIQSQDPALEARLMNLLHDEKVYRSEGLTIRLLAERMEVQEHRLRRLINGQLGFKNFNDFLNTYRVNEAVAILSDVSQNQKTILEIAYYLGYQSIGPFNKAFKELKNSTPTAFRKSLQQ